MKLSYLLAGVLLLAPAALAEGLPDLGDYSQTVLTPQDERRIGEEIMREIRGSGELVNDIEVADYVNTLGYHLVTHSADNQQAFYFFVIADPTINAFALPGGFVGMHTGLILNTRSESELASVLAHEIGHVVQRHMARMMAEQKRATLPSLGLMALSILMARANPQLGSAALMSTQAGLVQRTLDFTREHEREADRVGLQMLEASGFDNRAMPAFFETLMKGTRFIDGSAPSFLRTHPLSTERITDMRNRVEQTPYKQVLDSIEFHLIRAKLRATEGNAADTVKYFANSLAEKKYSNEAAQRYGYALALMRERSLDQAQQQLDKIRTIIPSHPMLETLAAQILQAQDRPLDTLSQYRNALNVYPKHRALIYGYAENLLLLSRNDEVLKLLQDKQLAFPNDGYLYELQSRAYAAQGKDLLRHQAQGEAYYRSFNLDGAAEQMELALKSGDGDFYQLSIVEARLKQLQKLINDNKPKE
ncbi:MAG: M48 family metalloprotease [Methylophilales bacterium]|nr:M48 family metalloprotease [Methylophilales bacterium]